MLQTDLFLLFTAPLDAVGIRYMVGGSVASMVYGEPRLTNDIDIVIDLSPVQAKLICNAFPDEGFYCPQEYVIIRKLEYFQEGGSEKHIHDIQGILDACSSDAFDGTFLATWISRLRLEKAWQRLKP
ncbi:MAG: hypothetical protein RRC34_00270 [Lentisphaeria bacterium]|nr:hypothetical protein [Lentisphaeria bacterium]